MIQRIFQMRLKGLGTKEIAQRGEEHKRRLAAIEGRLDKQTRRLERLYDALETGKLGLGDLAPRIKEVKEQIGSLREKRLEVVEASREPRMEPVGPSVIRAYVQDLRQLLSKGSILKQRSFLRSFIERIEVKLPQVVVEYTVPIGRKEAEPLT